jgi:predicted esterase
VNVSSAWLLSSEEGRETTVRLESGDRIVRKVIPNWRGITLAIAAVAFVGGWRLVIVACQPPHWLEIATELGSVPHKGNLHPNLDGTGLFYDRGTEAGVGVFFWDAATGQSKFLFEKKEPDFDDWRDRMLAWSPDYNLFACIVRANLGPGKPSAEMVLYDGNTGDVATKIPSDRLVWYSQFAWLSPRSFAYSSRNQSLVVYEQQSNGAWAQAHFFEQPIASKNWLGLTGLSSQSVMWRDGDDVWMFDFQSNSSSKIWQAPTNTTLESFGVTETGNVLLKCSDREGHASLLVDPSKGKPDSSHSVLSVTRNPEREMYADLTEDRGVHTFVIKMNAKSEAVRFTWEGLVEQWVLSGTHLFFIGSLPDQPTSIWEYDVASKEQSCLVPGLEHGMRHGELATPQSGVTTNSLGKLINYRVWEPVHLRPGKKYPLILGETFNVWFPYPQVAANEGYYFATVDRPSWYEGLDNWDSDVPCLYKALAENPRIDTTRVFLIGISAETFYLRQAMIAYPKLWRGAILLSPSALPELSNLHSHRVFIADGREDISAVKRLIEYQNEAAGIGIPVRLVLQNGATHITRSVATERERTQQFARFLLEN